ncbi:9680_t:CDS:2, partial [Entrophospora sp. SA101]
IHDQRIEGSYRKQVVIDDQPCVLHVLDTSGQEEYTALWDQWIRDGEGFLLIYSISSHSTFEQIERYKDQIIRVKGSNKIPFILVGNKCDKHTEREVSREEGINMAKRLGCEFFESSAKAFVNVERSFYKVVQMLRQKINLESISEEEKRFKNQLEKECILFHDYNSFQNIEFIDDGSFGTISCASSKNSQGLVALKSINIDQEYTFEQLINEAKQHHKVELHSNILGFYGITKEKEHKTTYMFVLEYANNGNLCDYLKYNFNIMDWNIKLKFAKQIVSAVRHLHENKIVHRDLHSKNILIHNGNIKICDFGISKSLLDPSIETSKRLCTIRYSDPEYLNNAENYSQYFIMKRSNDNSNQSHEDAKKARHNPNNSSGNVFLTRAAPLRLKQPTNRPSKIYQKYSTNVIRRTVYLGNLPPNVEVYKLINQIKVGPLESVKLHPDRICAFISFMNATLAKAFYDEATNNQIFYEGQELYVGWGRLSAVPLGVQLAVEENNASRNVLLENLDDSITERILHRDLAEY